MKKIIYDKKHAEIWIKNYESGKDKFRKEFLEPYVKKIIKNTPSSSKILDVGCGWGIAIKFLRPKQDYYGVDLNVNFFKYIRNKFKHKKVTLKKGGLPGSIPFRNDDFDLVLCSMVLLSVKDLKKSIKTLFEKARNGGKVLIIDFNDDAEKFLKNKIFVSIEEKSKGYLRGTYALPAGIIFTEVYFHKEKGFEKEIKKYGKFRKVKIGPIFMAYECIK